jgi:8-oxo-dGTP diphosphatase
MSLPKEFRIYVRALIISKQDEVLLIKKNANQRIAPNRWILPGGTCEWGEQAEEALIREIQEETNLRVNHLSLLGTETIIIEETHWQGLYYKAEAENLDDLRNNEPDKHEALQWHSFDELPEPIVKFLTTALFNPCPKS